MKKYFGLTMLFWSIYIILNSIMDSIIWHSGMFWFQNLVLWHWLKPFAILALFMTGWFASKLHHVIEMDYFNKRHRSFATIPNLNRKRQLRRILTIAFFIFYGLLWRWVWFEHLIDKFAGRL